MKDREPARGRAGDREFHAGATIKVNPREKHLA